MQSKLISEHEPGWLDTLREEIESLESTRPNVHVLALIDCVFNERCHAAIRKYHLQSRSLYDLSASPSHELQAVSPTLVPLVPTEAPAWREVLRHTDGWPMLSMIVTPESLDDVARRLGAWCIVSADGQPFVFRFPDTRRLPGVVDVLTPEQHAAFFGPAIAWRFRTRSAQWAELSLPETALPISDEVKLSAEQCARLIGDSEADEVVAHLNIHDPSLIRQFKPAEAYSVVAHGLRRADFYGIADLDRLQWCRFYLQQPRLEHVPEISQLMTRVASKECNYADIKFDLAALVQA